MGTYEQPGQVLDNSIGELSKGFAAMTAGLGAGLMQRNAAQLKAAKANASANQANLKWYKDIEKLRADFTNKDYPSGGIVDEKYQAFVEENLEYLYKMGKPKSEGGLGADSKEYQTLYNRTKELAQNSAAAVGLLNKSNEQFLGGYRKPDGTEEAYLKNLNMDGAFLNNPDYLNTLQFQYDWAQNEGAHSQFFVKHGDDGQILDYGLNYEQMITDDNGESNLVKEPLSFRSYVDKTGGGFGKFKTLDRKVSLEKGTQMWNRVGKGIEKAWKPNVSKTQIKTDGKQILQKSINADLYTEKLEEAYLNEENFDKNWGEITQNDWQTYGFDSHYTGTATITLEDGTRITEKEAFQRAVLDQAYKEHGYVNEITDEEKILAASQMDQRVDKYRSGERSIPGLPHGVTGGASAYDDLTSRTQSGKTFNDETEFVYADYVTLANELSSLQDRDKLADILSQMSARKNYVYKTSSDLVTDYKNKYKNQFPTPGTTYEDPAGNTHTFGSATANSANDADKLEWIKNNIYWDEGANAPWYDPTVLLPGPPVNGVQPTDKFYKKTGSGTPVEIMLDTGQGSLNQQAVLDLMLQETGLSGQEKIALQQSGTGGNVNTTSTTTSTTTKGELPTAINPDIQKMIDEGASNEELFKAITTPVDDLIEIEETAVTPSNSPGTNVNPGQQNLLNQQRTRWHKNQAKQTQYGTHFASTGGLAHHDDDGYYFGDRKIKESDFVNPPIDTKTFKGQGYIADMFNRESSLGNADGTGLKNYGFTGTRFEQNGMTPPETPEEALALVNKEIIGEPNTKTKAYMKNGKPKEEPSILYELNHIGKGIKLNKEQWSELEKDNPMVAKILVDYKFNTGRSVKDLITIAAGGDWDGKRAAGPNVKDATVLKAIDNPAMRQKYDAYKKAHKGKDMDYTLWFLTNGLDVTKMLDAREDLYTKGSKFDQTAWDKSQKNRI